MGLVTVVIAVVFILPASAALPAHTSSGYPATFWAKIGKTNTVTGKVISSSSASQGIAGAYVAIVNASNVNEVYGRTTSAADGSYSFTGVSATYLRTHDPYDYEVLYKIYAYCDQYGGAYSTTFGIDAAALDSPVSVWVVIPVNGTQDGGTAGSTAPAQATSTPTPVPTPKPTAAESTAVPGGRGWSFQTIMVIAAVVVMVLAVAMTYMYIRQR